MSIPIICLAKAEEPHRFEVAKVTADLVCTTCKSPDIDFDEVTAAAKTAEDHSCAICGRPGVIEAKWMSSTGNEVVETKYFCEDHRGSANNWSGDVETRRVGAKTATIDWKGDTHMGVGFLTGTAPNGDVYEVYSNPNSNPTPCSWVRYGPEGDTGLGSGIDAGRGFTTMQEAMAAAEEHAKGISTTAAKTADFTDPEMAEVKDTSSVSQKVTCSSCLTEHVITAVDPAQPMPACPSCGRDTLSPAGSTLASRRTAERKVVENVYGRYVEERRDGMEFRYYPDGSVTILDTSKPSGTNRTIGHTGPDPERVPPEFKTGSISRRTAGWAIVSPSGTNLWGMVYDTEEGARAHFGEVKGLGSTSLAPSDVASYEVKQVDAEPNRTYDPSLGGNKFQPLGSTRKTADAYQEAVRRGMMMGTSEFINPGAMLPSSVYVVMEPGPNGARPTDRKTTDRAEANRWAEELLARPDWKPYTSSKTAGTGTTWAVVGPDSANPLWNKTFDSKAEAEAFFAPLRGRTDGVVPPNLSSYEVAEVTLNGPDWVRVTGSLDAAFASLTKQASLEERIAAKINQIADGVLATNPGMNRQSALAVAGKTLATYPSMIEGN